MREVEYFKRLILGVLHMFEIRLAEIEAYLSALASGKAWDGFGCISKGSTGALAVRIFLEGSPYKVILKSYLKPPHASIFMSKTDLDPQNPGKKSFNRAPLRGP